LTKREGGRERGKGRMDGWMEVGRERKIVRRRERGRGRESKRARWARERARARERERLVRLLRALDRRCMVAYLRGRAHWVTALDAVYAGKGVERASGRDERHGPKPCRLVRVLALQPNARAARGGDQQPGRHHLQDVELPRNVGERCEHKAGDSRSGRQNGQQL